jgi:hypothetical protein
VAPKACTVAIHDLNNAAHQLDVTAEPLYEAVAQVLAMVQRSRLGRQHRDRADDSHREGPKLRDHRIVNIQDFENRQKPGRHSAEGETASDARNAQIVIKEIQWEGRETCGEN